MKRKKLNIAFDIDDTLWKIVRSSPNCTIHCKRSDSGYCNVHKPTMRQVPDYQLVQVLLWFHDNKHNIYVWSAGGIDYAQTIVDKLGLSEMVTVIPKNGYDGETKIDIAFDDCDTNLATVDVRVHREDAK